MRTKHINIDCHVIRKKLFVRLFHLFPIKDTDQPADIFTKAFDQPAFKLVICKIGMINPFPA